jgi:hypothetical protein
MKAKTFDCVKMMHRGAQRIRKQTAGMSKDQELAFWRERSVNFKQRQKTVVRHAQSRRNRESGSERGAQR